uniref:F-box domain-containing protein n=1 Tax=Calidris pygmaea TaxID=425635 RepID=A0A8C3K8D8_9CHAR
MEGAGLLREEGGGGGGGGGGGRDQAQGDFVAVLPPEVSCRIFGDLDVESLCRAAATCKGWHRAIEGNERLWRHHCLSVRAVCRREIDGDRGNGYSWKVKMSCPLPACGGCRGGTGVGGGNS